MNNIFFFFFKFGLILFYVVFFYGLYEYRDLFDIE